MVYYSTEVLQEAGYLAQDLQAEIAAKTSLELEEMMQAFEDAGVRAIAYDNEVYKRAGLDPAPLKQSPQLTRLIQRDFKATAGEWVNYTRTTANAAQKLFIRECDKAYNLVSSGAVSYTKAVRDAVENIASEGVTVTYPTGHTDTIETATLRAVRTGVNQACSEITKARMEEMDWDIVLVSAHIGARVTDRDDYTNHSWWQGKFYSLSGNDKRFPPYSVCGDGDVQGIHGANCRHSMGPGDGENNPYEGLIDSEENRKAYELSQRQRLLERRIRKTKREVMALKTAVDNAEDPAVKAEMEQAYRKKALLLQKQNKAYDDFCKENNLKRLQDRLAIAKWDRSQAASATAAAKKAFTNSGNGSTMGSGSVKEQTRSKPGPDDRAVVSDEVATDAYAAKMRKLGETENVTNVITYQTRNTLWRRNGTRYEDLIYVNSRTGGAIAQRGQNTAGAVGPTDRMKRMIIDNPREVIGIHNHPYNMLPSADDLRAARRYKYGLVACHNGAVIRYEVSDRANIDAVDKLLYYMQPKFNRKEDLGIYLRMIEALGVKMEVLL